MLSFKDYLFEKECQQVTKAELAKFEGIVDQLFKKFDINFDFTKHFHERMSHSRNNPCIELKEIGKMITKIYKEKLKGKHRISDMKGLEAVLHDVNSKINIPVAIEYDKRNDELRIAMKTIMRKKDFKSPDPILRY